MPHLVLSGPTALETAARRIEKNPRRWGRAVIKTEDWWTRSDGRALLVEGVVVEFSRALHPLAVVALDHDDTSVRLWPHQRVERTPAVQRWLALTAFDLQQGGAGAVRTTNIPDEIFGDIGLVLL